MKAQPFLVLFVLLVACIATVALLTWTPPVDPVRKGCRVEDPKDSIFLKLHGHPSSPAVVTSVPPCQIVRFFRAPHASATCYFIKESGTATWYLYPDPRAARIASMHAFQGELFIDMASDMNYTMERRLDDRFLANVPSADFLAFGTTGKSCDSLHPVL